MRESKRKFLIIILSFAFALVLLIGLVADLTFKGMVWQFFWSQTGETSPSGQIRGMVEVAGNWLRPQPQTEPLTPIDHKAINPFGINTFLQQEAETAKREEQIRLISEAGFAWIRQEFTWEDLEIDGRGQFTDSRNDYNGDGQPDTISSWDKYDNIVTLTETYGLGIIARLGNPPRWAQGESDLGDYAPPTDFQDFVNYAVAVAERYKGRIHYYQVLNEPNIFPEWGAQAPNPIAYTDLLCRTYRALKAVDPEIVILTAAIAPTQALEGYNYQDLVYLSNLYEAGAGDCFDILAAQAYGLYSGATDRRMGLTYFSIARHILYRDIMLRYGDAHKPIWLSEAGWNHILDSQRPPEEILGYGNYGLATQAEAASNMPLAYQRSFEEWSWVGNISYWFFTVPTHELDTQAMYYFRMADPDYSAEHPTFTTLPMYAAMRDYIQQAQANPVLYQGVHQGEAWQIRSDLTTQLEPADGAQFDDALRVTNPTFTTHGTLFQARIKTDTPLSIVMDGTVILGEIAPSAAWQTVTLYHSTFVEEHHFGLESDSAFLLDNVTVVNDAGERVRLLVVLACVLGGFFLVELGRAVVYRLKG